MILNSIRFLKTGLLSLFCLIGGVHSFAQGSPPWERPLKICFSNDGITFGPEQIFQDSSGVPSAVRLPDGTLVCAFQWFRVPQNSPTWDRVAVKFSYDDGLNWTTPVPVEIPDLPINFQRPFDPTLAVADSGRIRIYFSSSDGIPQGLDSTVNTYSAISTDGIHYSFEPGARFDHPTNRVIDPAVIRFHGMWHYTCPKGAPQDGAYHAISQDGINFTQVPDIPSDSMHNWTGNMTVIDTGEMHFYGSGPLIWYKSTANGGQWNPYVNTNVTAGDPTVVKISDSLYVMIVTGAPYSVGIAEEENFQLSLYPNPAVRFVSIQTKSVFQNGIVTISDVSGRKVKGIGNIEANQPIYIEDLEEGIYFLKIEEGKRGSVVRFVKR